MHTGINVFIFTVGDSAKSALVIQLIFDEPYKFTWYNNLLPLVAAMALT